MWCHFICYHYRIKYNWLFPFFSMCYLMYFPFMLPLYSSSALLPDVQQTTVLGLGPVVPGYRAAFRRGVRGALGGTPERPEASPWGSNHHACPGQEFPRIPPGRPVAAPLLTPSCWHRHPRGRGRGAFLLEGRPQVRLAFERWRHSGKKLGF